MPMKITIVILFVDRMVSIISTKTFYPFPAHTIHSVLSRPTRRRWESSTEVASRFFAQLKLASNLETVFTRVHTRESVSKVTSHRAIFQSARYAHKPGLSSTDSVRLHDRLESGFFGPPALDASLSDTPRRVWKRNYIIRLVLAVFLCRAYFQDCYLCRFSSFSSSPYSFVQQTALDFSAACFAPFYLVDLTVRKFSLQHTFTISSARIS